MNYRAMPFVRLLVPFALGIVCADCYPTTLLTLSHFGVAAISVVALQIVAAFFQYEFPVRHVYGLILCSGLFTLGYIHSATQDERLSECHFSRFPTDRQYADSVALPKQYFCGIVDDLPVLTASGKHKMTISVFSTGNSTNLLQTTSGRLLIYADSSALKSAPVYGQVIQVYVKPRRIAPPVNPHSFDYARYLHLQNIHYQAYLSKPDQITLTELNYGAVIWKNAFIMRQHILQVLKRYFGNKTDEYAVAAALLIGDKADLSDEVKKSYIETGSMHALAVSGTHVAFLYAGLMFFIQRIPGRHKYRRIIELLFLLPAIWGFTFLTGASASVLRASVMFSVYLTGKALFKNANVWNVLAASAFGLLIYQPWLLFDAGFQLSYSAVAGLVFFYPLFWKLSPSFSSRILKEAWSVLLVGCAAQLGTLPLSLYYFHQFPVYFWLSGWVVIAVGAIFMGGGTALILLDVCSFTLAEYLGNILLVMLKWTNFIISWIQHLPGSLMTGIWLFKTEVIIGYLIVVLVGKSIYTRNKYTFQTGVLLCTIWFAVRSIWQIQQTHQQVTIEYKVKNGTLNDYVVGHTVYCLRDSVAEKEEQYASASNRCYLGAWRIVYIDQNE